MLQMGHYFELFEIYFHPYKSTIPERSRWVPWLKTLFYNRFWEYFPDFFSYTFLLPLRYLAPRQRLDIISHR